MATQEQYWPTGGSTPVPTTTSAASAFIAEHSRLIDFALFCARVVVDKLKIPTHEIDGDPLAHDPLLQELILTRTVDNFLCFISDLLALIYKAKPEMLRSSEQERVDFVLQFSDMDQFRAAVAEKRVERLSYLGLKELAEYIDSHMSFQLFESPEFLNKAAVLVEMRNICVHSRGRVSSISARRFPELKAQLGKRIDLSYESVTSNRKFLENCVFDIDVRATNKFSLPARQVPDPPDHL
jgi:hypothetical protein